MKPAPRTSEEMVEWLNGIIRHKQQANMHGEIKIQMKAGKVISCKVEECHMPPKERG